MLTLIKMKMTMKNLEMMRNKEDIMESQEDMANTVTENTTKNIIITTVLVSFSGWA